MHVALKKSRTVTERLIDLLSGGRGYSHAELVFVVEGVGLMSLPPYGVAWIARKYPADQWTLYDVGHEWGEGVMMQMAVPEIGCRYDYLGVARFVLKCLRQSPSRWFCSELVVNMLQKAGIFPHVKAWKVSPNRLQKMLERGGYRQVRTGVVKVASSN